MDDAPDPVAQLDQFGAALRGFADALTTFHSQLVKGGIDPDVADEMVRELSEQWARGTFNKAGINLGDLGGK